MGNVLSEEKRAEILALGRLGSTLRRIEDATGVRRETASAYLKAAGVAVRRPRARLRPKPASAEVEALTDSCAESLGEGAGRGAATPASVEAASVEPASQPLTDSSPEPRAPPSSRSPTTSRCEPYRDLIEQRLGLGRNAVAIWQELVDEHGFGGSYTSVQRFVRRLQGALLPRRVPSS